LDLPDTMRDSIDTLVRRFSQRGIDFAFIGGVALALHGLPRATKDVDFIVDRGSADEVDALLLTIGFERLQRSDTFGNYLLGPLRVDLLFTKGAHTQGMLQRARVVNTSGGSGKLVCAEDLIGLKLQALANNPKRPFDQGDITALLTRFVETMDIALLRDYFKLFDKEAELDAFLQTVERGSPRDSLGGG
jgi:hypothetical protein